MSNSSLVKKLFKEHGLAPKKWMGQNLLVNQSYLLKIVQAARITPGESIVEIGAGLGSLTEALVEKGAKVWALELDSGFHEVLLNKFAGSDKVVLIHADALKYDFRQLAGEIGRLRMVANLPYNISSRLIFLFLQNSTNFSSLHILLQREVAERFVAAPGTKDYGVLTVLLGIYARVELLFDIPKDAFFPVPEIVSTFIKIEFPEEPLEHVSDMKLLTRLVKASFAGRRKTLRNTLKNEAVIGMPFSTVAEAAKLVDIDLSRRGETLSPREFADFANAVNDVRNQLDNFSDPGDDHV